MMYVIENVSDNTANVMVKSLFLFSSMTEEVRLSQIALQSAYAIDSAISKGKKKPLRYADEPLPKVKVQEE